MIQPTTTQIIRPARLDEVDFLHALTGRSTLSWGYEPEFLDWEPQSIAVTPELVASSITNVLEEEGRVVGYYLLTGAPPDLQLDKLFVEPDVKGTGRGKLLWQHAVATARDLGVSVMTFAADPNAAPFYLAMGAIWEGEEPTTRPGWDLQFFRVVIPAE